MFSKFSMFEHKESMNITEARKEKGWAQQIKNKKCESISLFFYYFLCEFRNDWDFCLL